MLSCLLHEVDVLNAALARSYAEGELAAACRVLAVVLLEQVHLRILKEHDALDGGCSLVVDVHNRIDYASAPGGVVDKPFVELNVFLVGSHDGNVYALT